MKYTSERNHQILIELLKRNGIKKIITSPGGTNVTFVASVQRDPFFELYSSVDERSAAYIACGMAEESGEPVVLSCTGATAARNYFSGLTEAFYRKLPILAVTSTMPTERIGHAFPQATDRSALSKDIAKCSVLLPIVKDSEDEWACIVRCNEAILELKHDGNGPVHINLETTGAVFDATEIKPVRYVNRIKEHNIFPELNAAKIAVFVGAHSTWSDELVKSVDEFCEKYNAVVIVDHTSNYSGRYGVLGSLITSQLMYKAECINIDLLIHIGNISGAYINLNPQRVWRVNEDGKIVDYFKRLENVFEMDELTFFKLYNSLATKKNTLDFFEEWKTEYERLIEKIPEIPYSNIWVAKELSKVLPQKSVLHLGILNSLRSWNFFKIDTTIRAYSNTGGFGIDGCVSSLLGAALASPQKLFYGIVGDLAFFYDMNVLGNRYFPRNIRLIVINNGKGQEFKNLSSAASRFGADTDPYIAAAGHFGNCSRTLVKNYVCNLGLEYLTANSKESFCMAKERFLAVPSKDSKAIVFEIFTNTQDETVALNIIQNLEQSTKENIKRFAKRILGDKDVKTFKDILKR